MSAGASAVVFGKLPAHGDFVARGVSGERRAIMDAWLSASLAQARRTYGEQFDERFECALPWRCAGPGVVGAIAASQDGAGRRFPLLLLCGGDEAQADAVEDMVYAAIVERWDADRLATVAGQAPDGDVDRWFGATGATAGAMPPDLLTRMLA